MVENSSVFRYGDPRTSGSRGDHLLTSRKWLLRVDALRETDGGAVATSMKVIRPRNLDFSNEVRGAEEGTILKGRSLHLQGRDTCQEGRYIHNGLH